MSRESNILFWTGDGRSTRDHHVATIAKQAEAVPDARVMEEDHATIAAEIAAKGAVKVPSLDRTNVSFERVERTVDATNVWGEPYRAKQSMLKFEVPFVGERDIFTLRPTTWDSGPPYAEVGRSSLFVTIRDQTDVEAVKRELDNTLDSIEKYLGWHAPLWENVEADIVAGAVGILAARKKKIEQARQADDGLAAFGFKPKS